MSPGNRRHPAWTQSSSSFVQETPYHARGLDRLHKKKTRSAQSGPDGAVPPASSDRGAEHMVHRVDPRQSLDKRYTVGEIRETVVHAVQRSAKPFPLTVKDSYGMSIYKQSVDDVRSDKSRTCWLAMYLITPPSSRSVMWVPLTFAIVHGRGRNQRVAYMSFPADPGPRFIQPMGANGSTERSNAAPTSSASFPATKRSSGSSAQSSWNKTTNGQSSAPDM